MIRNLNIFKFFLLLFLYPAAITCQIQPKLYSAGIKITMNPITSRVIEGYEMNYYTNSLVLTGGYYAGEEFFTELFYDDPVEHYYETNLLIGKYHTKKHFSIKYQGGIGYAWGTMRTDSIDIENSVFLSNAYFTEQFKSISLPLAVGGRYAIFKFMNLGIDIHANINLKRSFIRPMLCFEFGLLR